MVDLKGSDEDGNVEGTVGILIQAPLKGSIFC
jgi:hypothetical protein